MGAPGMDKTGAYLTEYERHVRDVRRFYHWGMALTGAVGFLVGLVVGGAA